MTEEVSRRSFLKIAGAAGGAIVVTIAGTSFFLQPRGNQTFLHRLFGVSFTEPLDDENSWVYQNGVLTIQVDRVPELGEAGGAVQLEDEVLPDDVLVVHGEDGNYYSFRNACTHAGRKIDMLTGTMSLQCCSVSESTYDYQGTVLSGPASEPLVSYPVQVEDGQLTIDLN